MFIIHACLSIFNTFTNIQQAIYSNGLFGGPPVWVNIKEDSLFSHCKLNFFICLTES